MSKATENQSDSESKRYPDDDLNVDGTAHDVHRRKSVAAYIIRVLLRISEAEEKRKTAPLNAKFLGTYLFGLDFKWKGGSKAESRGRTFRKGGGAVASVSELVGVLDKLRKRLASGYVVEVNRNDKRDRHHVPMPTSRQVLETLHISTRLSQKELKLLDLPRHSQHPLLHEAFMNLATIDSETVPDVYREVYDLSLQNKPQKSVVKQTLGALKEHVKKRINEKLGVVRDGEKKKQITRIEHAIERLLLQAGTGQTRFLDLENDEEYTQRAYIRDYLGTEFIDQLSDAVEVNNHLQQQYPVYLKKVALEPVGPFPLPKPNDDPTVGWFSESLLAVRKNSKIGGAPIDDLFTQLPSRPVMQVTLDLYIRLDEITLEDKDGRYRGFDLDTHNALRSKVGNAERVHFKVSTSGFEGTHSLLTRAVNKALLSDIACLADTYFPIAHDLFVKQTNIHQRVLSPVASHSLVLLCRNDTLCEAMEATANGNAREIYRYEDFASRDLLGAATFSNFDVLMSAACAAMLARLQAMASSPEIDKDTYICDVLGRAEQLYRVEEAVSFLAGYPFSSFALSSSIEESLLRKALERKCMDSNVVQNAMLTVAETFLVEGAYRKAYQYLNQLHDTLGVQSQLGIEWLNTYNDINSAQDGEVAGSNQSSKDEEKETFNVVSGQLLTRYEICLARYLMLLDEEKEQENKQYFLGLFGKEVGTRRQLVRESWRHLTRAEQHLTVRLVKFHMIDEICQATCQPYYKLLAQIYLHRAILFLWYPTMLAPDNSPSIPPTQSTPPNRDRTEHANCNRLYLLERARVYAGCDGDDLLYVLCTAYQCRAWIMAAFTMKSNMLVIRRQQFNKQQALEWARKLRNLALLQYAVTGQQCYQAVKEKSGLAANLKYQEYGNCSVESFPQIRETINSNKPGYVPTEDVLYLDMAYLAIRRGQVDADNPESSEIIYLFGPQASHLFFVRGLLHLSTNTAAEFLEAEQETPLEPAQWDVKLEHCYRLFTYAWSVAGNGCGIGPDQHGKPTIRRQLGEGKEGVENNLKDPHATSVWNLFPHRQSEMADVAVIFAAACAALRCYTSNDKSMRENEVRDLLNSVPYQHTSASQKQAIDQQERFNGYLLPYIERCSEAIVEVMEKGELQQSGKAVQSARDKLLEQIFTFNAL